MSNAPIRVAELFAGVGGFRIAMEGYPKKKKSSFEVIWSNQYEPRTNKQHANIVYRDRWSNASHCEEDIEELVEGNMDVIPDHDILVGGFPCQDFSVANRTNKKGLEGAKGKLWWSIRAVLEHKRPDYILLENVDRLLTSPSKKRGRDFAVILSCLDNLGYAVEWRIINAADYGFAQRRRRVFIMGFQKGTPLYSRLASSERAEWIAKIGVSAKAFPIDGINNIEEGILPNTTEDILNESSSEGYSFGKMGVMHSGAYCSAKGTPLYSGTRTLLGDILLDSTKIPDSFYIPAEMFPKWNFVKGAKAIERINRHTGIPYLYREGKVAFPDSLEKPSRTLLTREGGNHINREKHVVLQDSRYRRLHPIELERLNGFPDNFTQHPQITDSQRAFFMGNALVVGVVKKLAKEFARAIQHKIQ